MLLCKRTRGFFAADQARCRADGKNSYKYCFGSRKQSIMTRPYKSRSLKEPEGIIKDLLQLHHVHSNRLSITDPDSIALAELPVYES